MMFESIGWFLIGLVAGAIACYIGQKLIKANNPDIDL